MRGCGQLLRGGARLWHGVSMPTPAPLPADLRDRAFSTTDALRAGVRHSRLRRRDLAKPFHGVRATSDDTFSARCAAAQTRFDARHFFSHTTAARILGLPLPAREEDASTLHVAVIPPYRAPKGVGVIGHQLRVDPARIQERGGFRIPSAVEVWCELAATLTLDELVQAGDALVRRNAPLADVDQLTSAVRGARHRPGSRPTGRSDYPARRQIYAAPRRR